MSRRRVVAIVAAAALIPAGWWAFGRETIPESVWGKAERGDLVLTVEVTGTLQAVGTAPIGPPQVADAFDFKISMMAPEGKDVAEGTPVLAFDATELSRKLLEKQAESDSAGKRIEKKEKDAAIARESDELRLAEATSRMKKAELELEVPEDLVQSNQLRETRLMFQDAKREMEFLSDKLAAKRRADEVALNALKARKTAADRRVREIQASIDAMTVKAPRAGTVVYTANQRDEKKKVGDSAWRGERILEIPDLSEMKGEGEVDESDAGKIVVGQKIRFRLEAHPDNEFTGRVASIWGSVQRQSFRSPVKVVKLNVAVDTTDPRKMRPGMRFRGVIETGRISQTLLVPADAVFPTDAGPVAFRKTALGYERQLLALGARNATSVEVKDGLDAGDAIARRDLDAAARSAR
jgi:HlyD family secretion protein